MLIFFIFYSLACKALFMNNLSFYQSFILGQKKYISYLNLNGSVNIRHFFLKKI